MSFRSAPPLDGNTRPILAIRNTNSQAPAFSEEALALQFAVIHQNDLRHVPKWGWLNWEGHKWVVDDQLVAFDLARDLCRQAANECNKRKQAGMLASAKTVAAVERLARSDRRLIASTDQWDADPFLLEPTDTTDGAAAKWVR